MATCTVVFSARNSTATKLDKDLPQILIVSFATDLLLCTASPTVVFSAVRLQQKTASNVSNASPYCRMMSSVAKVAKISRGLAVFQPNFTTPRTRSRPLPLAHHLRTLPTTPLQVPTVIVILPVRPPRLRLARRESCGRRRQYRLDSLIKLATVPTASPETRSPCSRS